MHVRAFFTLYFLAVVVVVVASGVSFRFFFLIDDVYFGWCHFIHIFFLVFFSLFILSKYLGLERLGIDMLTDDSAW